MRCGGVGEKKALIMYGAVYFFGPRWGLGKVSGKTDNAFAMVSVRWQWRKTTSKSGGHRTLPVGLIGRLAYRRVVFDPDSTAASQRRPDRRGNGGIDGCSDDTVPNALENRRKRLTAPERVRFRVE